MTKQIVAKDSVVFCEVESGVALLDTENNRYFSLNSTGAVIWTSISEAKSMSELCEQLAARFEVSVETCRPDVERIVASLVKAGLADIVGAESSSDVANAS